LLEILVVLILIAIVSAMVIPPALAGLDRSRGLIAARFLAGRLAKARIQAVNRSAIIALRFAEEPGGIAFQSFQDRNQNGVLAIEILAEIDLPIDEPTRLWKLFPGAVIGLTPDAPAVSPVQLAGGSDLLSFTPNGTATGGTVYVRGPDGTQWGVRVLGATGRTRLMRWDPRTQRWFDQF
jgi:type II secretory pathway pseudopilin PulG